jgi:signal recognition particle subunit SRP19
LKDYDHIILWLDYFNKNLKRRQGRKVRREEAIFDPTIDDLVDASKAAGFEVNDDQKNDRARYPRRSFARSGYVMLAKKEGLTKSKIVSMVATKMLQKRNKSQKASAKKQ